VQPDPPAILTFNAPARRQLHARPGLTVGVVYSGFTNNNVGGLILGNPPRSPGSSSTRAAPARSPRQPRQRPIHLHPEQPARGQPSFTLRGTDSLGTVSTARR